MKFTPHFLATVLAAALTIGLSGCTGNTPTPQSASSTAEKQLDTNETAEAIKTMINERIARSPRVVDSDVKIVAIQPVRQQPGWNAYTIVADLVLDEEGHRKNFKERMVYFSNGSAFSTNLMSLQERSSYTELMSAPFAEAHYTDEFLIAGTPTAPYKLALFSDPLCPFCVRFFPDVLEQVEKYPGKYALYYYPLALSSIHPASDTVVLAAEAAKAAGVADVDKRLYVGLDINPRWTSETKILARFNELMGSELTVEQIHSADIEAKIARAKEIAEEVRVSGTPSLYVNGKRDRKREAYKQVVGKKGPASVPGSCGK